MFAPEFDYYKASSVAEAIHLLGAHDGAKLIAGGQSLIPLLKLRFARPTALIDIGGIADLKSITVNQGAVRIGALATHRDIASSHEVGDACSLLAAVAGGVGVLRLTRVQRPGKAPLDAPAFLRGYPLAPGTVLA